MSLFVKCCVLLFVLAQFCVSDETVTQFDAYCDIVHSVKPGALCKPTCANSPFNFEGVSATCTGDDITVLKASGLGLKTLPASLNAMTKLTFLNVADNALTALPVLDALTELKQVYIFRNKLTNITGVFPNSKKLLFVSASDNQLLELPPEFASTQLGTLNFQGNNVTTLPAVYAEMRSLVGVAMSNNFFNCSDIKLKFVGTLFALECVQAQQKTENDYPPLPTSFPNEPPQEGLDGLEVASVILACVFVVGAVVSIVLYVRYRRGGIDA